MGWGHRGRKAGKRELIARAASEWYNIREAAVTACNTLWLKGTHRETGRETGREAVVTWYHHTAVRIHWADDTLSLDTGGWNTPTTRVRMSVGTERGILWYKGAPFHQRLHYFGPGQYTSDIPEDDVKRLRRYRRAASAYWHTTHATPEFLGWLAERIKRAPKPRRAEMSQRLDTALCDNDVSVMVRYLRMYIKETSE